MPAQLLKSDKHGQLSGRCSGAQWRIVQETKTMRLMTVALVAACIYNPGVAAMPVSSRWLTADKDAVVEIGSCDASVCGRVSRLITLPPGGTTTDINNPTVTLRHRSLLGLPILTDFVADGDVRRGRIYDLRKGKTYKSFILRQGDGTLKVQGCIAFLCQTQIWTRAF